MMPCLQPGDNRLPLMFDFRFHLKDMQEIGCLLLGNKICYSSSKKSNSFFRRAQISDSGCYLCEVNTEPVSTLFPVYLNVVRKSKMNKKGKC